MSGVAYTLISTSPRSVCLFLTRWNLDLEVVGDRWQGASRELGEGAGRINSLVKV